MCQPYFNGCQSRSGCKNYFKGCQSRSGCRLLAVSGAVAVSSVYAAFMADHPEDPFTPLAEAATQHHEAFLAWQAAGFTEAQAFELVKVALAAAFGEKG